MGILKRLFGKIEEVNKGEAALEELDQAWTINLEEEANDFWFQMEQNLLINTIKAAGVLDKVERAFVLVNFKQGQETFELFYQVAGQLVSYREMDDEVVQKLEKQLLPQASEVAKAVNSEFQAAGVPLIDYAMLQFETQTTAWFGRKIRTDSPVSSLSFQELVAGWRAVLEEAIPNHPLDSDTALPYFEG